MSEKNDAQPEDVTMEQVDQLLQADQDSEMPPEEEEASEPEQAEEQPEERPEEQPEEQQQEPRGDLRVALREERERRRQADARLEQLANQQRVLSEYLGQISRQVNPQQQEPQIPDFDSDPAGHLRHQVSTLQQTLGQLNAQQQEAQREAQKQAAVVAAQEAVSGQEAKFAQSKPDYFEAVGWMRDRLKQRFVTLGVPEDRVDAVVAQDMRTFGMRALQSGSNPAEKIYKLAKLEGYTGPRDESAQKLATVAKGQAASRGARSSAPASSGDLSLEQAASLSYKDIAKMNEDQWAKLMGGA